MGWPFVGCVPPVKSAALASRNGVIGVLATPATVRGRYLRELCAGVAPGCRVLVHGAAGLAALAEARFAGVAVAPGDVRAELHGLLEQAGSAAIDAMALGCTHYALLLRELRGCLPPSVAGSIRRRRWRARRRGWLRGWALGRRRRAIGWCCTLGLAGGAGDEWLAAGFSLGVRVEGRK